MRYSSAGQGATEYLVLLAVVLIIALVSIALLGFFPGMAGDAQITESQMYWRSASPISVSEAGAKYYNSNTNEGYLRMKNTGTYPIRITKIFGGAANITVFWNASGYHNISDTVYLAPGEEDTLGWPSAFPGLAKDRQIGFAPPSGGSGWGEQALRGAESICSAGPVGTVSIRDFGFEYIVYVEGQAITKRQMGKPLVLKCIG